MSWNENLRPARFRDITFFTNSTNSGPFGRRLVRHKIPGRDVDITQDVGSKEAIFRYNAYFRGENSIVDMKSLIASCQDASPGELVDPMFGSFIVKCTSCEPQYKGTERLVTYVSLVFEQVDEFRPELEEIVDSVITLVDKRNAALESLTAFIEDVYDVVEKPYSYLNNATQTFNLFVDELRKSRKIVETASAYTRLIQNSITNAAFLLIDAARIIDSIVNLISFGTVTTDGLELVSDDNRNQFQELTKLFTFTGSTPLDDTDPSIYLQLAVQTAALICAIGLIAEIEFDSLEDIETHKEQIVNQFDKIVETHLLDDDSYTALYELQRVLMVDMEQRSATVSRLTSYLLPETLPSVRVVNELYGSLDEEEDVIDRNDNMHPGFMPGGTELEVRIAI